MALEVLKPGLSTTVQDLGRPGYYHLGIPISAGWTALRLRASNLLVGNDEGAAALEAVFHGAGTAFDRDAVVAVTGAEMPPKIDGVATAGLDRVHGESGPGSVLRLSQGRRARLRRGVWRHRCAASCSASRSTYPLGALGGFEGRALKIGDKLKTGNQSDGRQGWSEAYLRSSVLTSVERRNCACFPGSIGIA